MTDPSAHDPGGLIQDVSPSARALRVLRHWLDEGRLAAGERLLSEAKLASTLGVSRTSLRRALQILTEEGALEQDGQRRKVARSLADVQRRHQRTIAMFARTPLLGLKLDQRSQGYDIHIHFAAVQALSARRCHILLCPAGSGVAQLGTGLAQHLSGAIVTAEASGGTTRDLLEDLRREGTPVVVQADATKIDGFDSIASDHAAGSRMLVDWLLDHGARKIVRLWELPPGKRIPDWVTRRDAGARTALAARGLPPGSAVMLTHPEDPVDGHSERGFQKRRAHTRQSLRQHLSEADAILCITDGHAFHIHAALEDLGRRPGSDVLVAGYDNYWHDSVFSHINAGPALTIDKDCTAMGTALVELLMDRLDGSLPPEPQHRLVKPTMVVREDCVREYRPLQR